MEIAGARVVVGTELLLELLELLELLLLNSTVNPVVTVLVTNDDVSFAFTIT